MSIFDSIERVAAAPALFAVFGTKTEADSTTGVWLVKDDGSMLAIERCIVTEEDISQRDRGDGRTLSETVELDVYPGTMVIRVKQRIRIGDKQTGPIYTVDKVPNPSRRNGGMLTYQLRLDTTLDKGRANRFMEK